MIAGIFGSSPGAVGQSLVISNGTTCSYGSKEVVMLQHGDVVSLRTSGAAVMAIQRSAIPPPSIPTLRMDMSRSRRRGPIMALARSDFDGAVIAAPMNCC